MNEAYDIDLASLLEGIVAIAAGDVRITDLTLDSRAVRPGSLFFALAGGVVFMAFRRPPGRAPPRPKPQEG